ncbi:hypothetical protein CTheo_4418 [Ceratobasidium theobromae]|uniref:Uncharacterized protein n=1 Tax=Ceratobasidium theobromae TaxID=1582974 RepID=A0A5N5QKT3_9AGAM|nr:hypothetical protein CTheo_4418 [Ceratobasidium theobromae]
MSGRRQSFPRQARYDKSSRNELTDGGNQNESAASTPLKLMTDESLASALDTPSSQPPASPNPGGNDLEAWVESSKRTIVHGDDKSGKQQSEAAPS